MESSFLIWLVDYGTYIRPTENTVYVSLPAEYKKLPSKVFEASIHGVTPIGLVSELKFLLRKHCFTFINYLNCWLVVLSPFYSTYIGSLSLETLRK